MSNGLCVVESIGPETFRGGAVAPPPVTPRELFALGCVLAAAVVVLHAVARELGRPAERTNALTLLVGGQVLYLLAEIGTEGGFGLTVEPALSQRVALPLLGAAVAAQVAGGGLFCRWLLGRFGDEDAPDGADRPSQQ